MIHETIVFRWSYRFLSAIFLFSSTFFSVFADTIYLRNGRAMEGVIRQENESGIKLEVGFGTVTVEREEILRVERTEGSESALQEKWEEKKKFRAKIDEELSAQPKTVRYDQAAGHIIVSVLLNKKTRVLLLLDTGASLVILTNRIAQELGIDMNKLTGDLQLQLADGRRVLAKRVLLESVKVEDAEVENVEAAIIPTEIGGGTEGLLGMSFLKNFNFRIDQDNKKLILEKVR